MGSQKVIHITQLRKKPVVASFQSQKSHLPKQLVQLKPKSLNPRTSARRQRQAALSPKFILPKTIPPPSDSAKTTLNINKVVKTPGHDFLRTISPQKAREFEKKQQEYE